jgi:hypothetical protein
MHPAHPDLFLDRQPERIETHDSMAAAKQTEGLARTPLHLSGIVSAWQSGKIICVDGCWTKNAA